MVYEINMDQVDINDRLSNQVYCYDKDLRTLRIATDTINKSLDDVDRGAISTPEREGRIVMERFSKRISRENKK